MAVLSLIIRIVTLPSVLTGATAALLWLGGGLSGRELLAAELCLMVIPLLAYPISDLSCPKGADRRSRQRSMAMVFSAAGYTIGLLWALMTDASPLARVLFGSYVLSTLVLLLLNKGLHFKASGHACSTTAPLIFLSWQLGPWWLLPCALVAAAVYAASLRLRRHSFSQLIAGSATSLLSGCLCILIFI